MAARRGGVGLSRGARQDHAAHAPAQLQHLVEVVVVHAVGGILLLLYMKLYCHEKLKISGMPWYLYSAGFFGIFLVVTSSYCIGALGVSVMTCLSVTGQLVISAVIDHFGWFGVPKIPFNLKRLPCFALILIGLIIINLS